MGHCFAGFNRAQAWGANVAKRLAKNEQKLKSLKKLIANLRAASEGGAK